jgi:hypothetical protein
MKCCEYRQSQTDNIPSTPCRTELINTANKLVHVNEVKITRLYSWSCTNRSGTPATDSPSELLVP